MAEEIFAMKGDVFGDWKATGLTTYIYSGTRKVKVTECVCKCGITKRVRNDHLFNGRSKNCGCEKGVRLGEWSKKHLTTHGLTYTKIRYTYQAILSRCNNKNNPSYYRYGGRGIKCRWKTFEDFYKDMNPSFEKHLEIYGKADTTIERINHNGDYCKENCRWATMKEQANNKSTNHKVSYKGVNYPSISMLCKCLGLKKGLISDRIVKQNWSIEDAVEFPLLIGCPKHDKIRKSIQSAPSFTQESLW